MFFLVLPVMLPHGGKLFLSQSEAELPNDVIHDKGKEHPRCVVVYGVVCVNS